jgi:hypothetical protein
MKEPEPEYLYHYTNASALMSIVVNNCMWCTNIGYLNDSREWVHCFDLARHIAATIGKSERNVTTVWDRIERLCQKLKNISPGENPFYIASFSERADDLSQWRGYAPSGGIAIRFEYEQLKLFAEKAGARLSKCIYSEDEQRGHLMRFIVPILERLEPSEKTSREVTMVIAKQIATDFKDCAFKDEAEWRIVLTSPPSEINFRESGGILIPYVKFSLGFPDFLKRSKVAPSKVVLDRCMVGPGNHPQLTAGGLKKFFDAQRLSCEVEISTVPWRQTKR